MAISRAREALPEAVLAGALVLAFGCAPAPTRPERRTPVRWILIERPAGELVGPDSGVSREAPLLVLEPVPGETPLPSSGLALEILEAEPPGAAEPGEVIRVTLRVARAEPGALYRLKARPLTPAVRILGAREALVRGGETAVFRFTSLALGRAGISVETRALGGRDPDLLPGAGSSAPRVHGSRQEIRSPPS